MKRLVSCLLAFALCFTILVPIESFASNAIQDNFEESIDNLILSQAVDLDPSINIAKGNFNVVSLSEDKSVINVADIGKLDRSNKAIQTVHSNNEYTEIVTIFPYKCLATGELVSSFEYSPLQTRDVSAVPTGFVDVTITVIAYYAHYFSENNIAHFYRHAGVKAYWSSNNASANVTNMYVIFDSAGELYKYPECLTADLNSTRLQNYYFIRSTININNPIKNQVYMDGNHAMAINRVLLPTDYFEHGGLVYLKLTYSVNGKNYTHDRSYYVYSK